MRRIRSVIVSIAIILGILLPYLKFYTNPLKAIARRDSNYYVVKNAIKGCSDVVPHEGKYSVVLRIDDPHAFFYNDIVFKMVDTAVENNAKVVLGVIPYNLEKDKELYTFLEHNRCNFEIALHGWDHSENPPEFLFLSLEDAFERMVKGKLVLEKITEKPLVTFIAPQNAYSDGTIQAAKQLGFKIFSSERKGKYGFNAATYDFGSDRLIPYYEVIDQCVENFEKDEPCVIMIHPQDYATNGKIDEKKFVEYIHLIKELKMLDISFVTFDDLVEKEHKNFKLI